MFSLKIRYSIYGMIISASLITLVAQASTVSGAFGGYFQRMTGICSGAGIITGFDNNPLIFGDKACKTLTSLLDIIGIYVTPSYNIGIGTFTSPTAKLEVNGKAQSYNVNTSDPSILLLRGVM